MPDPFILSIDQGTTSSRAVVYDAGFNSDGGADNCSQAKGLFGGPIAPGDSGVTVGFTVDLTKYADDTNASCSSFSRISS